MNDTFSIIFFVVIIAISIPLIVFYEKRAKQNIIDDLTKRGCQEIEINRSLVLGRREMTYDVIYRDPQGDKVINSCVVEAGLFSPGDVYWKNPI